MAPSKGAKRAADDDTDMDTDKEDTKRAVRRTRAAGINKSTLKAETDNTPGGDGAVLRAPPAAPPAAPAAQPIQMNIPTIVQELNSLMLTLHSRAIENQQESASLLAEITRLQTVYNAWIRDIVVTSHPPGSTSLVVPPPQIPSSIAAVAAGRQPNDQDSILNLAKSLLYPGSQPMGGVAIDSDEHIAQIESTTALVKAEIERLKVVLEEKKKAKLQQLKERGDTTSLTPELMALLQERPAPAPADVTRLPQSAAAQPSAGAAVSYVPPSSPPAPPSTSPRNPTMQANSVLERRHSDLANAAAIDGFGNPQHAQQQPTAHPNDLLQHLLQGMNSPAQYNPNLSGAGGMNFAGLPPRPPLPSAGLHRPTPQRHHQQPPQQQQHHQQQQLTQQQLELINTLAHHANIQIDHIAGARQQQQQQQRQPGPGPSRQAAPSGGDTEDSATFAAMLLDIIAQQRGEGGK